MNQGVINSTNPQQKISLLHYKPTFMKLHHWNKSLNLCLHTMSRTTFLFFALLCVSYFRPFIYSKRKIRFTNVPFTTFKIFSFATLLTFIYNNCLLVFKAIESTRKSEMGNLTFYISTLKVGCTNVNIFNDYFSSFL